MTLIELQVGLGYELKKVMDSSNGPKDVQQRILDEGSVYASLAKQMINNADIMLRTEKLVSEGKLRDSTIQHIIG